MKIRAQEAFRLAFLLAAPAMAQSAPPVWTLASQQQAEAQIVKRIDETRRAANLPPLKSVKASESEIELVCTAALTGSEVHDPMLGNLHTYVTGDLNTSNELVTLVALGTSGTPDGSSRWRVYSDESWPRFSVVVLLDSTRKADHPMYRVGLARRPSAFDESIAPLTGDNPVRDGSDWKKQVAAPCVAH
jgi:hypothetical protein